MEFKYLLVLFFIGLFPCRTLAQKIDTAKLNDYIDYIGHKNQEIGNISVFKEGKEVYNRNFGQPNIAGLQYNENTKYHIGSITKLFTATLIWRLIGQGKLNPDERLADFFPDMPNAQKITIKNLLEHSSGLGDYLVKTDSPHTWLNESVTDNEILKEIKKQGTWFEPGDRVSYSNSGYYLLTKILEDKCNKNFGEILNKEIINPLHLSNTFSIQSHPTNIWNAYSYSYADGKWKQIKNIHYDNITGVGDMVSTPEDMNKFVTQLFRYKVLDKVTIDKMKPVLRKELFGRGLQSFIFDNTYVGYGHSGNISGTHSIVIYFPGDELTVSYAINGEKYPNNRFLMDVLDIIYSIDFEYPEFSFLRISPHALKKYLGTYSSPELSIKLTVTEQDSILSARATGQPSFPLKPYKLNKFKYDNAGIEIEFAPEGKSLILRQHGKEYRMEKEE